MGRRRVLEEELRGVAYSARDTQNVCKGLTVKIRRAVKVRGEGRGGEGGSSGGSWRRS